MPDSSARQARRVAQRRNGQRESPAPAAIRYASESISDGERRQALVGMVTLGLAFPGLGLAYVVMAAGGILG